MQWSSCAWTVPRGCSSGVLSTCEWPADVVRPPQVAALSRRCGVLQRDLQVILGGGRGNKEPLDAASVPTCVRHVLSGLSEEMTLKGSFFRKFRVCGGFRLAPLLASSRASSITHRDGRESRVHWGPEQPLRALHPPQRTAEVPAPWTRGPQVGAAHPGRHPRCRVIFTSVG